MCFSVLTCCTVNPSQIMSCSHCCEACTVKPKTRDSEHGAVPSDLRYSQISKEMSSLYFGLKIFCQFEARVLEFDAVLCVKF